MNTKPLTIKDAKLTDIDYIKNLQIDGVTMGGALSKVIELSKQDAPSEEKNDLKIRCELQSEELKTFAEQILIIGDENEKFLNTIAALKNENQALKKEIEDLQVNNSSLVNDIHEIRQSQALKTNSVLIDFTPSNQTKLTSLRRLLKTQNKIPKESTEQEFTSRLVNEVVSKHLANKYEFIK